MTLFPHLLNTIKWGCDLFWIDKTMQHGTSLTRALPMHTLLFHVQDVTALFQMGLLTLFPMGLLTSFCHEGCIRVKNKWLYFGVNPKYQKASRQGLKAVGLHSPLSCVTDPFKMSIKILPRLE